MSIEAAVCALFYTNSKNAPRTASAVKGDVRRGDDGDEDHRQQLVRLAAVDEHGDIRAHGSAQQGGDEQLFVGGAFGNGARRVEKQSERTSKKA